MVTEVIFQYSRNVRFTFHYTRAFTSGYKIIWRFRVSAKSYKNLQRKLKSEVFQDLLNIRTSFAISRWGWNIVTLQVLSLVECQRHSQFTPSKKTRKIAMTKHFKVFCYWIQLIKQNMNLEKFIHVTGVPS